MRLVLFLHSPFLIQNLRIFSFFALLVSRFTKKPGEDKQAELYAQHLKQQKAAAKDGLRSLAATGLTKFLEANALNCIEV